MLKNKGFILIETMIVMSVLLVGMIILYSNYNNMIIKYGKTSYYDNVEDMYTAYYVYINKEKISYDNKNIMVMDINNDKVLSNLNIEKIYYIKKDTFKNLYDNEADSCENFNNINCFDGTTISYLLSIKNKTEVDKCENNNEPCITIVKINRDGNYYFAMYEAYDIKPTAPKHSTTTTTATTTTSTTTTRTTTTTTTKPIVYSFANDSWSTIANNVRKGLGYKYNVGDEKEVNIDGTNYTVRVANNTTPSECNGSNFSETACGFVVEFVDIVENRKMNSTQTNVGGWPVTAMRTYANEEFFNKLPIELQNVIIDTKVISGHGSASGEANFTSTDKIYLLSAKEVYIDGSSSSKVSSYDSAYNNTRQLDYYASKGVTTSSYVYAIKQDNDSNENLDWWLRSASSNYILYFYYVGSNGGWGTFYANTYKGVAPAFRIG